MNKFRCERFFGVFGRRWRGVWSFHHGEEKQTSLQRCVHGISFRFWHVSSPSAQSV